MGSTLHPVTPDLAACREEIAALGRLLTDKAELGERRDVLPFFRANRQLAAYLGTYDRDIGSPTRLGYEYSFLGDFTADLVVGNRDLGHYLVVEFEDGKPESLFRRAKRRNTVEWSPRFEHGFSQLVDWFRTLDDYKHTTKFEDDFGRHATFTGLLVVGRDAGLADSDRVRLRWRTGKVLVDSRSINCVTFDGLHRTLAERIGLYPLVPPPG